MDTLDRMPFDARKAVFDKLLEVADVASLSREERVLYDEALKQYRDYKNTIDYAEERGVKKGLKEGRKEGMKKGLEKGRKEGLIQGIEKGRVEGIEEGLTKGIEKGVNQGLLSAAKGMKAQNLPVSVIAKVTGLSPEEIEQL